MFTSGGDILLRKAKEMSMDETAKKVQNRVREENINVDMLAAEAVEWARKAK